MNSQLIAIALITISAIIAADASADPCVPPQVAMFPSSIPPESVSISGNTAVVGIPGAGSGGAGAARVFRESAGSWNQIATLTASDGSSGDSFGISVSISGNTIAVGAYADDRPGAVDSGSVYIFRENSGVWQQIAKLTANDASRDDYFGSSVSIVGNTAFVGAYFDDHAGGINSGSVYVFRENGGTWQQLARLFAANAGQDEWFGWTVSAYGDRVAVGRWGFASSTRAVNIFREFAGTFQQEAELTCPACSENDQWAFSVSLSADTVIVGAPLSGGAGAAYVYQPSSAGAWQQVARLTPTDPAAGDWFGNSVSLSHDAALIGAPYDDHDGGEDSGAAYLFRQRGGSWQQIAKFTADNATPFAQFGTNASISGDTAVVNATRFSGGATYFFDGGSDRDGDGLLDDWECNGIPYTGVDGTPRRYLLDADGNGTIDANPLRKDIFVEIDAMVGLTPLMPALDDVVDAFDSAPVSAPPGVVGGLPGITLHLVLDDLIVPRRAYPNAFMEFQQDKAIYFGTNSEGQSVDWPEMRQAKQAAYRYCIFADSHSSSTSGGIAELGGNDLIVTLGTWNPAGGTRQQQAGIFMHELGHSLGLQHGGADDINWKQNYYSVMNYLWTVPTSYAVVASGTYRLDYSNAALPTLDEGALSETAGIGGNLAGIFVPYITNQGTSCPHPYAGSACLRYARFSGSVDWNNDGNTQTVGAVSQNINSFVDASDPSGRPSGQRLEGHDDWRALRYGFSGSTYFADNRDPAASSLDLDFATVLFLNSLPPPPDCPSWCRGDLNCDGFVTVADIGGFVLALTDTSSYWTQYPDCDINLADVNVDGFVTVADIGPFVVLLTGG